MCSLYNYLMQTAFQRSLTEDLIARVTTPMYRPPEVLDLYMNFVINEKQVRILRVIIKLM